jgi:hypothetical protein
MDAGMESILSFYTWWPPEDDVAEGMEKSLDDIVSLGFTTISFDIQYHWLIKARNDWETLIGACDKRGLKIVPVVSYGFLPNAGDLANLTGMEVTTNITSAGENTDCVDPNDLGNVQPYVEYLKQFIDEYCDALYRVDGRTLLNFWEPSMIIWSKAGRIHLGYGQDMVEKFRRWALDRGSLGELNDKWSTSFSSPDEIQPPKVGLWDQDRDIMHIDPNPFWDDWCLFRAGILARYYRELFGEIKSERSVEIALGLSQHGVITQHDAYHQRCVYLPYWRDVPADKFIVSDDLYCKGSSEVKLCMEAELSMFHRLFGDRITAFITPVEGGVLVEKPSVLYDLCEEYDMEYVYLYAWNEMADGANIRDHREIWPEIAELVKR